MKLILRCESGRGDYTLTSQERVRHLSHQHSQRKLGNGQEGRAMQHTRELIGEFRVCRCFRSNAVYRPFKRRGENRMRKDAGNILDVDPGKPLLAAAQPAAQSKLE